MTAHARARKPGRPDLNHLQHLRLFSPAATIEATARGIDSPELDAQLGIIAGFLKHARDPHCLLCVRPIGRDPPSLIACLDAPGFPRMVFVVCKACGDYPEAEQKILDKIGSAMPYSGSA
jgi:hypothetical protein